MSSREQVKADAASSGVDPSDELRDLSGRQLQRLLAGATKEYSRRRQEGGSLAAFGPYLGTAGLTATDAVILASAVLDALGVEVFELGMWKTWGAPDG